ncbi:MAG: CYTH domain-containing protein [Bacilli bacterium]|nr:CYTH domain-containing protein [Bacilli bacterium]
MSSNNIEIESKVLLSKADYEKIVRRMNFPENDQVQTNYYMDSDERILKKYGMILRIRQSGEVFVFTMKAPLSEGLLEKNQNLTEKEADSLINHGLFPRGEIQDFLEMLQIKPASLKVLATLTTTRKIMDFKGTTLDISKNVYGNRVDYELECDSDSAIRSETMLKNICEQFDIRFKLNTLSKENRAINAALEDAKK